MRRERPPGRRRRGASAMRARAAPRRRRRAPRRLVEQPDRRRRGDQPGQRQPPALPGRQPAARPVGDRVEPERAERRLDAAAACRGGAPRSAAQKPSISRGVSAGLSRVEMADIVEPGAIAGEIGGDRRSRPTRAGRRPARAGSRAAAAGSTCRCRWRRSAPARRRPAGGTSPAKTSRSPRRQASPSATRSGSPVVNAVRGRPDRVIRAAATAKKRLRRGNSGAARSSAESSAEYEVWGTNL